MKKLSYEEVIVQSILSTNQIREFEKMFGESIEDFHAWQEVDPFANFDFIERSKTKIQEMIDNDELPVYFDPSDIDHFARMIYEYLI